jgi:hypothetical protein
MPPKDEAIPVERLGRFPRQDLDELAHVKLEALARRAEQRTRGRDYQRVEHDGSTGGTARHQRSAANGARSSEILLARGGPLEEGPRLSQDRVRDRRLEQVIDDDRAVARKRVEHRLRSALPVQMGQLLHMRLSQRAGIRRDSRPPARVGRRRSMSNLEGSLAGPKLPTVARSTRARSDPHGASALAHGTPMSRLCRQTRGSESRRIRSRLRRADCGHSGDRPARPLGGPGRPRTGALESGRLLDLPAPARQQDPGGPGPGSPS